MTATRILAIRHGETDWNTEARIQGHTDIALNTTGVWQAQRLAQALADEPIDCIYSSDLQRAQRTAQALAHITDSPRKLLLHRGLRERSFGTLEGLTFEQIATQSPQAAQRWKARDPDFSPPQGETLLEFSQRVANTVHALASQHLGEHIALVAHGGVLDVIYRLATQQNLSSARNWELGNAAINRLLWSPQGLTIVGWSDTRHLDTNVLDERTA
jgi:2,3-bisphosphoglycerate-dependent phosphoglycerate mutase